MPGTQPKADRHELGDYCEEPRGSDRSGRADRARRVLWTALGVAACILSGCEGCALAEPGFRAPEGAAEETSGTLVVRRDNPALQGNAYVEAVRDDGPDATFVERRRFGPRVAFVDADAPALFDSGRHNRAYLWSEDSAEVGTVGAAQFAAPSVRLPTDHSPLELTLWSLQGRTGEPEPGNHTIGFDEMELDRQTIRLDDRVLVVPVRATMFVAPGTRRPRVTEEELHQLFDPGRASTITLARVDGGAESVVELQSGRYHDNGATGSGTRPPDEVWTTCDIQFRLLEAVVVEQDQNLERQLIASTDPCGPLFDGPLNDYLHSHRSLDAIPFYVGGNIQADFLSHFLGVTCPPQSGSGRPFVAVEWQQVQVQGIVAHELGHYLGLGHTSSPEHLMTPPASDSRSVEGTLVTPAECTRARCDAALLLSSFGIADRSLADAECESFRPVCGNGEREHVEGCDDGNRMNGDGCRDDCTVERCGDVIVDFGEDCDTNDPGERENCDRDCRACDGCNICGNGEVGLGEVCDDGNLIDGDGCSSECFIDGLI